MEKIYINLVKNEKWSDPKDKVPMMIGPKNMKHPDKNWTIGVNVNGQWYNQAGFVSKDENGNPKPGEMTIILTPSGAAAQSKNDFAKAESGDNNEYTF